jgi:eukaryotic-like serine/threonine-protein kinase
MKTFGSFHLDPANHCLWRDAERVSITPKAYDVLCHLVENSGRLVTQDEMLEAVWADTYVNPEVLRKYILEIRKALGDKPNDPQFVETVPKRGYRFIAPVCADSEPATSDAAERITTSTTTDVAAPQSPLGDRQLAVPSRSATTSLTRSGKFGDLLAAVAPTRVASRGMGWMVTIVVALVVVLLAVTSHFYLQRTPKLTDKDTIVLADFANSTGDPVFDDTLKTALSVTLNQSPFLNVVSDNKVATTLKLMTHPPDTKLTSDVASELCQRVGSKAYLIGSIASLGSQYVLGLKAVDCQSGNALAQEQATAAAKEKVLDALGEAGSKLRGELGESLATVQKLDAPLYEATTSSLEALKAYSLGDKEDRQKGSSAALPYFQRAIELDPKFAMAYNNLGLAFANSNQPRMAADNLKKAFDLRYPVTQPEKFAITANYYRLATGDIEKSNQNYEQWIVVYPHTASAYGHLGSDYMILGQYEKAAAETREYLRLVPTGVVGYVNLGQTYLALNRFDAAKTITEDALRRKLEGIGLHLNLYALAFFQGDMEAMKQQADWAVGKPDAEDWLLSLQSDTEAWSGNLGKSRELSRKAVESGRRNDEKEPAACWQANAAIREGLFGNREAARRNAAAAAALAEGSRDAEAQAALAYALAEDVAHAQSLADDIGKRLPKDTVVQSVWLPTIRAQIEIARKNPARSVQLLEAAEPYELGMLTGSAPNSCLYPVYVRAQAYLNQQQASAVAEFRKILDHHGLLWGCATGPLAHLGLARAYRSQRDAASAKAAYKDFLSLWKNADPDIPILKQAQAEYATQVLSSTPSGRVKVPLSPK